MTVMQGVDFQYQVGEEVVFRLDAGAGTDVAWSIGEIVERGISNGRPRYTVRFRDGDDARTATVAQDAIEGVA